MIVANYPGISWTEASTVLTGREIAVLVDQIRRQQQAQQRG